MDQTSLSRLFDESEKRFTITKTVFNKLSKAAEGVGNFVANNSPGVKTYLQGSFAYGTIIRPYRKDADGDYDIDLVIQYPASDLRKGPQAIKSLVGDRLKNSHYFDHLEEGKRCWTLNYHDAKDEELRIHLDVLPSVFAGDKDAGGYRETEIRITNRGSPEWGTSNPLGYREWLSGIDKRHCGADTIKPATNINTDVERAADPWDSTPLRSAVKILKRSRDVFFSTRNDTDYSPISIIITTVAANVINHDSTRYNNVASVLDIIIKNLKTAGPAYTNGKWVLKNPVDSRENFADRWNDDERYATAYNDWYAYLADRWQTLTRSSDESEVKHVIETILGIKKDTLQNVKTGVAKTISVSSATPKSYVKD